MKNFSYKKLAARLALVALSATALLSCGGGNSKEAGDYLPENTVVKLIMNNGTNAGHPYVLSMTTLGNNLAQAVWESKTTTSGTVAYSFYREGAVAKLTTSFYYTEGSYLAPGPIVITTVNKVLIQATLTLPDDISSDSYVKGFSDTCEYHIEIQAPPESTVEDTGTSDGQGNYHIQSYY